MRVRRVLVTCLAGAVTASALPAGAGLLPAAAAPPTAVVGAPAAANWSNAVLAPSLQQLRNEVNARWPSRSRASDGWLGDARHQRSKSQHNPVGHPNGPANGTAGAVHALDITSSGVDPLALVGAILGDSRVWYIIYDRTIWSHTYNWKPRPYLGAAHTTHVHISLRSENQRAALNAERSTRPWLGKLGSANGPMTPTQVKALQRALIARGFAIPAGPTGFFGSQTKAAVAAFQRSQGWSGSGADGVPGTQTKARLGLGAGGGVRATLAAAQPKATAAPSRASASSGSFVPGARGAHIKGLQQALINRGIRIPSGATGFFGNETRQAVAAFQRSQGWSGSGADGVPGSQTLARLGVR
jgi:peptidoglycan hydrolase-like protein with peptidoglycan-binding domain